MAGMSWRRGVAGCVVALGASGPIAAQGTPPIMDNSFLMEEAYNQERGVVQHVSLFTHQREAGTWTYSFTQEWPFRGQRHQLSYTVPVVRQVGPAGADAGIGDVMLNYRLQVAGGEGSRVWVAPRLSAILPTGRWQRGRGDGGLGVQLALPISVTLAPKLVTHFNAGMSLVRKARGGLGDRADLVSFSGGASVIFLATSTFNVMLETIVSNDAAVTGPGTTARNTAVFMNPGVRWAHNFSSGLQIVPGIAYTIGLRDAGTQSGLLLYLSFEHPLKKS